MGNDWHSNVVNMRTNITLTLVITAASSLQAGIVHTTLKNCAALLEGVVGPTWSMVLTQLQTPCGVHAGVVPTPFAGAAAASSPACAALSEDTQHIAVQQSRHDDVCSCLEQWPKVNNTGA